MAVKAMPCVLQPFKPGSDLPVSRIEVDVSRSVGGCLGLTYRATGVSPALLVPELAEAERTDELWRHTCFEVFIQAVGQAGYLELNFSPSSRWASYRFDDYRQGMAPADIVPDLAVKRGQYDLVLTASLHLPDLADADWRLALSAVIESVDGTCSYWAAAHPPGKPDFHHPSSFALTLAGG